MSEANELLNLVCEFLVFLKDTVLFPCFLEGYCVVPQQQYGGKGQKRLLITLTTVDAC